MTVSDRKLDASRVAALNRYHILDTDPESSFDEVTAIAAGICATPMALISLVDDSRQWFKSRRGLDVTETPREIAFCHHAIERSELLEVEDASQDPRFCDNPLVTQSPNIRYYAGAPIVSSEGYRLGTLCVLDQRPRRMSQLQRQALQALASQVMSQLEVRRALFETQAIREQLEGEVERRTRLERMYRRAESFLRATGDSLQDHIAIIGADGEIIQVNKSWVEFARENAAKPVLPGLGPGANYLEVCDRAAARGATEAAAVGQALRRALAGELAPGFSLEYPCHGRGAKRWFLVQISAFTEDEQNYAVVSHLNVTKRRQAEEELRVLNRELESRVENRTEQLSQANEQLRVGERRQRALAARLRQIREDERRQISREIHDELGQMLTALKIDLTVLQRDLDDENGEVSKERLRTDLSVMTGVVDDTLGSLKRIARRMRPEVLDTLGLVSALYAQAADFSSWSGVDCTVNAPEGLPKLDDAARTALFRIVQESLTNIARHAQASRATIAIELNDRNELTICIADDGVGFAGTSSSLPSLGLLGMRERASDIDAELDILSQPGAGTTVTVTLQLTGRRAEGGAED